MIGSSKDYRMNRELRVGATQSPEYLNLAQEQSGGKT